MRRTDGQKFPEGRGGRGGNECLKEGGTETLEKHNSQENKTLNCWDLEKGLREKDYSRAIRKLI